ncbi:hypothetical protein AJ80_09571 [Polytolypa hystricis UAMH7299]|uniref:MARVEL domain-containing protein n=1 Tax=Polytolypa hystricis (strain UAMH7299) TaxID=1447883 RepID=A0A2B7WFM4_POLH7|nr:hypothetical protein AJ80_09571 [Polytolypa hystricis UAMH7299]
MSPPSDSGSQTASFASNEEESTYLVRSRLLHWTRVGLSVMIIGAAAAAAGLEGRPLHYFHQTRPYSDLWLYLWPEHLDLRPSHAAVACAGIITFLTLCYLVVSFLPSPHSRTMLLNIFASFVGFAGVVVSIISVALSSALANPHTVDGTELGETINTWTCKWSFADGKDHIGDAVDATDGFGRYCRETRASFALMCVLIVLEVVFLGATGCGYWLEAKMGKKRRNAGTEMGKMDTW